MHPMLSSNWPIRTYNNEDISRTSSTQRNESQWRSAMLMRELCKLTASEKTSVEYLQQNGVISTSLMSIDMNRFRFRCRKRNCDRQIPMRSENAFLRFEGASRLRSGLPVNGVLELLWTFLYTRMTLAEVVYTTGYSEATVLVWNSRIREVCSRTIDNRPQMVGTERVPVQIDESFFSGRRKYGRGRLLAGNRSRDESVAEVIADWNEQQPEDGATYGVDDDSWAWVVGIYESKTNVRFFRVRDRTNATLVPLIRKYVAPGHIDTDLWRGYNHIVRHGFTRRTVNHTEHYIDPITGAHTQGVERSWRTVKDRLRLSKGNRRLLQNHLDEMAWRMQHADDLRGLFTQFLEDVKVAYNE